MEQHDLKDFQKLLTEARSHLSEEKVAWVVGILRAWADTRYDVESVATLRATGAYKDFSDEQPQRLSSPSATGAIVANIRGKTTD